MSKECREKLELIKKYVGNYSDFPKPGIMFRDIFGVLREPQIFSLLYETLFEHVKSLTTIECVVGLDSRGFLFGPIIALNLKIPFVPIRKKGKLPGEVKSYSYKLEYGEDTLEVQINSMSKGLRVLLVDDLLATGGSLSAACKLLEMLEVQVVECLVIIELMNLNGREKLKVALHSFLQY